jgi:hypothetical protein
LNETKANVASVQQIAFEKKQRAQKRAQVADFNGCIVQLALVSQVH